jgi:hypothetical protein
MMSGNDLRDSSGEEVLLNVDVCVIAVAVPARMHQHTHNAYPENIDRDTTEIPRLALAHTQYIHTIHTLTHAQCISMREEGMRRANILQPHKVIFRS